ncbi:MAG TPA: Rid family hydrolase [Longimicrobiaceae bacterium]|nr:Rid family hydrolase [Longimicrobiaceae bacterium]
MMPESRRRWEPVSPGSDVPPPRGAYSPAVRAGDFVYVSGQVPRDAATGELRGGDTAEQTRYTLEKLEGVLRAAGGTLADVVSVTAYLQDIGDWEAFDRVYAETFRAPYPTRTTVGADLGGVRVEISAVAYLPR